jgi:hypothetical protein
MNSLDPDGVKIYTKDAVGVDDMVRDDIYYFAVEACISHGVIQFKNSSEGPIESLQSENCKHMSLNSFNSYGA